jgi:hypothetical protein
MNFGKIFIIIAILVNQNFSLRQKTSSKNDSDFDVMNAVEKYCNGRTTNFCSKEHLFYVNKIEKNRQMENQKKRVKNKILKNAF